MKFLEVGKAITVREQKETKYRCMGCIFCDILAKCILGRTASHLIKCDADNRPDKKNIIFVTGA